ncbi:hypothetical protein BDV29DRAFT_11837 [Aspergillus leporis]|uniref:Amine oxidase n=1 Tax=Aspergillus leporis TaxID=41062 RepID=A0A5N5WX62_9EURO|nr:hypothetical protein BDV29DRAFT_11837 [Aspergillus leporis]
MANVIDVAVIGAGLSGLQAALDIHNAGHSVIILEARDRVGGKTRSVQRLDGKGMQEIGAAWVNDTNQFHVWDYCQRFGLTPVVQNINGSVACEDADGTCHLFPFGEMPRFQKAEIYNIVDIRDFVEATCLNPKTFMEPHRAALDSLTFEQWLRDAGAGTRAIQTATLWCRGTSGQDPGEISALAFLEVARGGLGIINLRYDGKDGGQHLRIREGTQSISNGIAKLLPSSCIKLSCPIASVTQTMPQLYSVTSTIGFTVKTRKVIISIPSPAYKDIQFDPPLPHQRQIYTTSTRYGCFVKFICLFKAPFWRSQGACGLAQSFRGPVNHCRDTSVDADENYALTCFLCSEQGRRWLALNSSDRRDAVLYQLGSLFGVGYDVVRFEFIGSMTSEWPQDRWAGWGCPFPVTPPGVIGGYGDGQLAMEKCDGLYFVGTEFTDEWRGYMEGALRSGKRGAAQALQDLRM